MTDVLSRHLQEPSAAPAAAPAPWPSGPGKIRYGGDYNPEQWSRETWVEDISLMQEAGINLVSIGIFSWVLLEPSEGRYEFGWLDELMDLLDGAGIGVDLGTPTAAPPAWFWKKYPQALPVTRDGVRLGGGSRGMASPSSPQYRRAATAIAEQLAVRYGSHPALVMWHVHNEYGAPVSESYDDASVEAFRIWLQKRYGTLDDLNEAWGTTFWGQRYGQWDEIDAPRTSASVTNQTQRLDFRRFTSEYDIANVLQDVWGFASDLVEVCSIQDHHRDAFGTEHLCQFHWRKQRFSRHTDQRRPIYKSTPHLLNGGVK